MTHEILLQNLEDVVVSGETKLDFGIGNGAVVMQRAKPVLAQIRASLERQGQDVTVLGPADGVYRVIWKSKNHKLGTYENR